MNESSSEAVNTIAWQATARGQGDPRPDRGSGSDRPDDAVATRRFPIPPLDCPAISTEVHEYAYYTLLCTELLVTQSLSTVHNDGRIGPKSPRLGPRRKALCARNRFLVD